MKPSFTGKLLGAGVVGAGALGGADAAQFGTEDAPAGATGGGVSGGLGGLLGGVTSALGGAGVGALLGGAAGLLGGSAGLLGGSKQAGTVTQVQDIPDWLKPYVIKNLEGAQSLIGQTSNNPLLPQAQDEMSRTIAGNYLNPLSNPYLRDTYDQAARAVTDAYRSTTEPRTDYLFGRSGNAFGANSGYQETVARNQFGFGQNLSDLATDIYGGNYGAERNRQSAATLGAPAFATGRTQAAFSPYTAMNSLYPNVRSNTQPYFENPFSSMIGGALLGSQIFRG